MDELAQQRLIREIRRNPAVIAAASSVFLAIVEALEAETLQGSTAHRVATAALNLAQMAGIDANGMLASLSPETQQNVRGYFA